MNRIEHNEDKWIFPFVEYSCKTDLKKLPLIIQLHGAGERGEGVGSLHLMDCHGFSKYIKDKEFKCLFIMPQCPSNTFWTAKIESVIEFIEQIIANYDVDEKRVYLTGLSMGGFGTWLTAMARPDLFAAIAPVCGGGMAWNADVLNMPIWTFHGTKDTAVSVRQTEEMVEKLISLGANVKFSRLDGIGHNAWDYTYNDELLNWLLAQKR